MKINNKNIRRILVALSVIFVTVFAIISAKNLAYANADSATVAKKLVVAQMDKCIKDDYFESEIRIEQFSSIGSIFPDKSFSSNDAHNKQIYLPSGYGHSVSSNKMSCLDLFKGTTGWTGLAADKFASDDKGNFLDKFGYSKQSAGGNDLKKCVSLNYKHDGVEYTTDQVCFTVEYYDGQYYLPEYFDGYTVIQMGDSNNCPDDRLCTFAYVPGSGSEGAEIVLFLGNSNENITFGSGMDGSSYKTVRLNPGDPWSDFISNYTDHFMSTIKSGNMAVFDNYGTPTYVDYNAQSVNETEDGQMTESYKYVGANVNTIKSYLGVASSDYNMNPYDYYSMYDHFIFDTFNLVVDNTTCRERDGTAPTGNEIYVATSTSEINICAVTEASINNTLNMSGVVTQSYESKEMVTSASARDIITWNQMLPIQGPAFDSAMANNELTPRATLGGTGTSTGTSTSTGDGEDDQEDSEEAKCYQNAKSLGWVICPIIYGLRDMTEHFYEAVEPLLETNESIVGQLGSNDSGLYKSWLMFRNVANIIFVILFMFIIFSQLTGYGIDNYGIKKMLPKLILTAIIVNLSYIICSIAVDVSNIVGHGIKGMLEQMGAATGAGIGDTSVSAFGTFSQKAVAFIAVAGTTAVAAGVAFALEGWALIIPILLFLLTIVISIFFALVILGVRQALVVILIVVSPVAFACSLLPNTEPIFKKWFSASKGILMVYPIVGAVIGAGYLTASILMSSDQGFIMTLVSGILMVVPYFMIPSLTRKALDGIGMLGSKIGNIGRGASARTKGAINGAEATKNFRADQAANAKYRRANSKLSRWMDNKSLEAAEKNKGKRGVGAWVANHTIASNGRLRAIKRHDEARVDNARESVMQGAQAARNNMNRMEHGGFAARAANLEDKALEDAIADQTSLWEKDGTFSSDSKFFNEVKSAALGNDDVSKAKLEALMRKAAKGSDKQREILRDAMSAAFKTGGVSSSQAARYGAHLTGNSIYKSNDRSMHDQGTAIMNAVGNGTYGSEGNTSADFANENFVGSGFVKGKQSAESAFSYDDGEFAALAKKMSSINEQLSSGNISAEERTTLENTKQKIAETLGEGIYIKENDPNNKYANVNDHIINEMKKVIEAGYGAEGAKQFIKSDSLKVDHTDATAQADAQQTSATQAAQRIQDAARNRASVPTNVIVDSNGNPLSRA